MHGYAKRFIRKVARHLPERARHDDVLAWLDKAQEHIGRLPPTTVARIQAHELNRGAHAVTVFALEIGRKLNDQLSAHFDKLQTGTDPVPVLTAVVNDIVRWKTIIQCRDTHTTGGYYDDAEPYMASQWEKVIEPITRDLDFDHVLELAPGLGRNTEFLRCRARTIHLVHVISTCIEACRKRFGRQRDGCSFYYDVTDGNSLPMIADQSVTLIYSFDAMVHFDKLVVRDYVREFRRILRLGGCAFIHHWNLGALHPDSDWAPNTGNRSDRSAQLMREYAADAKLAVRFQRLSGMADGGVWTTSITLLC